MAFKLKNSNSSSTILPPNIPHIKYQFHIIGLSIILLIKSYLEIIKLKVPKGQILEQIVTIGFNTLPMVILITTFSGMVASLETSYWLNQYGARDTVGSLICLASVVEIAPVFVSFEIGAKAGTAITAELGHMQITEQISAMRLSKVNPINYLIAPRLVAIIYSLPISIIIGAFSAIIGGMIIAYFHAHIEFSIFLDSVWRVLKFKDVFNSFIKAFLLSNYLIAIHTSFGLSTRGGAKEVGIMTSLSTIWATVGVVCLDAILDYFMYVD